MSDESRLVGRIASKRRKVLIEFKSMQEILNTEKAWFDHHGNLCVHDHYGGRVGHLSPAYFHYLGKQVEGESHWDFPGWAVKRCWDDLFAPNMALRAMASGKLSREDMIALAKSAVLVPHEQSEQKDCGNCGSPYCAPCEKRFEEDAKKAN